jgi:hypothetical protein
MGFSEWYKSEFPDLDPDQDDMYLDLEHAWNNGYSEAKNDGWQPIETAPMDGTEILTWHKNNDTAYLSVFNDGWWVSDCFPDTWTEYLLEPTNWMPLPEPPK